MSDRRTTCPNRMKRATKSLRAVVFVLPCLILPLCLLAPVARATTNTVNSTEAASGIIDKPIIPKLNVDIGVKFAGRIEKNSEGKAQIPWLAQYISAFYSLIVGMAIIAAAAMIVYGGFLYIIGSSMASVSRGKEVIRDAIIGLILVFCSYLILSTVKTGDLSKLGTLNLETITPEYEKFEVIPPKAYWNAVKGVPSGTTEGNLPDSSPRPGSTFASGGCQFKINQANMPTAVSMYECAVKLARDNGIPPCYAIVAMNNESFLAMPNSLGHDENAFAVGYSVNSETGEPEGVMPPARLTFLRGGLTYKKNPIRITDPAPPDCTKGRVSSEVRLQCFKAVNSRSNGINDDTLDPTKPDLGLDWRFTHGIGAFQATLSASTRGSYCINGLPEKPCFSAQELLNPEKGILAGILEIKALLGSVSTDQAMSPETARRVWYGYAGTPTNLKNPNADARASQTTSCDNSNPLAYITSKQFMICRGDAPLDRSACADYIKSELWPSLGKNTPPDASTINLLCKTSFCDSRLPISCSNQTQPCVVRQQ